MGNFDVVPGVAREEPGCCFIWHAVDEAVVEVDAGEPVAEHETEANAAIDFAASACVDQVAALVLLAALPVIVSGAFFALRRTHRCAMSSRLGLGCGASRRGICSSRTVLGGSSQRSIGRTTRIRA